MFVLIFLALLGSVYAYSGWRLLPYLPSPAHWAAASVLLLLLLLLPLLLFRLRSRPHLAWAADPLAWIAYLSMGFFTVCSTLLAVRDLGGLLLGLVHPIGTGLDARIDLATFVLALAVTGYGFYQARRTPAVHRVEIPIENLPTALAGLRIVQISDLHVGPTIKGAFVERIVARIRDLQPDLIVFTGDLADGAVEQLAPHTAALARLTAPLGLYFCTGNHEYYSDLERWTAQARRLGFDVLINEARQIEYRGTLIALAGATDFSAGELVPGHASDPAGALAASDGADVRILLAHQPRSVEAAAAAGCHLQLSGHTHGGQFVPWKYAVLLQQPFIAGLHKVRDTWIYVHRGTGYWGPPLRLGAPSEIALLTLRRASDGARPV
ncbi:MAG: metallophosphoesterase [Gemmatimonadaceae bacterium]|nr:metallophosphoesterase [Gemmatimonadaceae bacterium]